MQKKDAGPSARRSRWRLSPLLLLSAFVLAALTLAACGEDDIESLPEAQQRGGVLLTNVAVTQVQADGWTLCYSDTYDVIGTPLSTILSQCQGAGLMLACRPTGAATLTVAASGRFSDVTTDTGGSPDTTTLHTVGGIGWYYNTSRSWGFVAAGDGVFKNSCDTETGAFPGKRLCWHTSGGTLSSGWRCGTNTSLGTTAWERLVFRL